MLAKSSEANGRVEIHATRRLVIGTTRKDVSDIALVSDLLVRNCHNVGRTTIGIMLRDCRIVERLSKCIKWTIDRVIHIGEVSTPQVITAIVVPLTARRIHEEWLSAIEQVQHFELQIEENRLKRRTEDIFK